VKRRLCLADGPTDREGNSVQILTGYSQLPNVVAGTLSCCPLPEPEIVEHSLLTWNEELERYFDARREAVLELAALYDIAAEEIGKQYAAIFAVHAMLLEEEDVEAEIIRRIKTLGETAQCAVLRAGCEVEKTFNVIEDPYMRARACDVWDITRRLACILTGTSAQRTLRGAGPIILMTKRVTPSEMMLLDCGQVSGVVTEFDVRESHTAILAARRGLPFLMGVSPHPELEGLSAVLNGADHCLVICPEADHARMY